MKPSYARALATLPLLLSNLIVPVGFFAAASLMIPTRGVLAASSDYLPADLRSRVDQLKADLTRIPTDQTNARARAELTWQWLNAFALEGGYVPVNATQVIAYVLGNPQIGQGLINALNNTISELAFLEDHPGAIGELVADLGPFPAGGMGTIQQTYTVGNRPIQTGGGLMIARHFMADFGAWQTNDPAAPNYVSIATLA